MLDEPTRFCYETINNLERLKLLMKHVLTEAKRSQPIISATGRPDGWRLRPFLIFLMGILQWLQWTISVDGLIKKPRLIALRSGCLSLGIGLLIGIWNVGSFHFAQRAMMAEMYAYLKSACSSCPGQRPSGISSKFLSAARSPTRFALGMTEVHALLR